MIILFDTWKQEHYEVCDQENGRRLSFDTNAHEGKRCLLQQNETHPVMNTVHLQTQCCYGFLSSSK
jgi:hypothetical protein